MKPSCETVEYANTFLMSVWATAIVAANSAVSAPTVAMTSPAHGYEACSTGAIRVSRKTPDVTMVAACIRADTGVGPSIASGNHKYNGNCALLPQAPTNNMRAIPVAVTAARPPVSAA